MSLYSAMYAGVSALKAQSNSMAAIGDNIANVNTIGYKDTDVSFSTLITKQTSSTMYSAGGVLSNATQNVSTQGSLTATASTTDIALSGEGFFVVNTVADPSGSEGLFCYTRAGSFSVDEDGYLQNDAGFYMMGWPLSKANGSEPSSSLIEVSGDLYTRSYRKQDGTTYYVNTNVVDTNELKALNINELGATAEATLNIKLGANLPGDYPVGTDVETTVSVYDALGITHNIDWTWGKTAANTWDLATTPPTGSATINTTNADGEVYYAAGQLEFTGAWDNNTTLEELDGVTFDISFYNYTTDALISTTTFELDYTGHATLNGIAAGSDTAIDISTCTGWEDVMTAIVTALNAADTAAGAVSYGVSGDDTTPTRFSVSDDSKRVIFTQSGTGGQVQMGNFVDNTANDTLGDYLVTAGGFASGTMFTISELSANGNYWGADLNADGDYADAGEVANNAAVIFNGDGTPDTINVKYMNITWANGAENMTGDNKVTLFFGNENMTDGLTQLSAPYQVNYLSQDGAKFGNFAGIEIDTDGVVTALFDNGVRTPIFQIPVATFVNPNGMEALTGNVWIATDSSGTYTLHIAGTAGAGQVNSGALETSTVDLATEFTTMIVTQRAYSAASKVITTANDMLDDLLGIVR